jgi:deoxycytidylate deaminase
MINKYSKMFMDIAEITAYQSNCVKYKVGTIQKHKKRIAKNQTNIF